MPLNWVAHFDTIELNEDGDCVLLLGTDDRRPFPDGTVAELRWRNGPTWIADIVDDTATWKVEAAETAAINDRQTFTIWLRYPNPDEPAKPFDYPWVVGYAQRSPTETGFF